MMNLFARILSHAFGLIIVALLAIGLIYRGELFPEWELPDFLAPDSALEETTEAASGDVKRATGPATEQPLTPPAEIAPEVAEAEPAVPAPAEAAVQEAQPEPVPTPAQAVVEVAQPEPVPAPAEAVVEVAQPEPVPTPAEAVVEVAQPEPVPAPVEAAEEEVPPPKTTTATAEIAADVPRTAATQPADAAPAPPAATASPYRLLAAAREAYWLRDYVLAEEKYRELIAQEPDNPDGYGELGNMYFSQGEWEQASAAYYEAGVRLAEQGYLREARQLVEVIRGLNGSQAEALEQKIQSAE